MPDILSANNGIEKRIISTFEFINEFSFFPDIFVQQGILVISSEYTTYDNRVD